MRLIFLFILCFICNFSGIAQNRIDSLLQANPAYKGRFARSAEQSFGFYRLLITDKNGFVSSKNYKSVGLDQTDVVDFKINPKRITSNDSLMFESSIGFMRYKKVGKLSYRLTLPASKENYIVQAKLGNEVIAELEVIVLPAKTQRVVLVPLVPKTIQLDSLKEEFNHYFKGSNTTFEFVLEKRFQTKEIDLNEAMENPDLSRLKYSNQMHHIRNLYLKENASKVKNSLLFFITADFKNPTIQSYMVKNKALGFITHSALENRPLLLAKEYLFGFVNSMNQNDSLNRFRLTNTQWIEINENPAVFSYIDDYEEVVTNNGLIAYYFLNQDEKGDIVIQNNNFLSSVQRPLKKNTYSYHLQIDNFFYKTIFSIAKKPFNFLHILSFLGVFIGSFLLFKRIRLFIHNNLKRPRFLSFISRFIQLVIVCVATWLFMLLVDLGYDWFEVKDGIITEFSNKKEAEVLDALFVNTHPKKIEEKQIGSELIIRRGENYYLYERKKVLYFRMIVDENNRPIRLWLISNSDSLNTTILPTSVEAKSHYVVLKTYSKNGKWLKDQVYNHLGVDLTEKLTLVDPPKRILIFVNGYRPTSLGGSFEENFADIRKNGLEFPNSLNRLFTEDRYNYWHPWMQIDDLFKARINPTEFYFADGHHSVSTSNHRSLVKFTTSSQTYPHRCKNENTHVCYETKSTGFQLFGSKAKKTYSLLATKSNKRGFRIRENSGRIAGRNLFQLLNELPNTSKNDTLYIVAHSMGFAYAQGLIKQMEGKIQLGGYYIIAPENAKAGRVKSSKWQEIWQYGSNLGQAKQDAPCLQDGVAPQSGVRGLPLKNRLFIPAERYKTKGYFDSHFIGWYTWILEIPQNQQGAIKQH